ncbi:MAG: AraC family transcriptional regulator [Bacteroidales bacterium]|nr:AraC family transcriptional regulator [Bacteroidales bacterium]
MRLEKKDFSSVTKSRNGVDYEQINLSSTTSPAYGFEEFDMSNPTNDYGLDLERMHAHDFYFVAWAKRGHCELFVDVDSYQLNDNTLIFMNPGQFHFYKNLVKNEGAAFCFGEDFFTILPPDIARKLKIELLKKLHILKITERETEERLDMISRLLMIMMQEEPDESHRLTVYSTLSSFLLAIMASPEYKATMNQGDGKIPARRDLYVHFLDLVERDFARKHLVREYLDELHVSQKLLSICTNDNAGETPLTIINDRLMLEAKRQLLYTDMRVKEIASKLGFDDPAHFVKFFKRHLDASPSDFRTNTVISSPED